MVGAAQDAPCAVQGNPFELLLNICGGDLGPFTDIANIDIDMQQSLSPTWSLGFLWEPNAWFALGAVYQSEAKMHLKGRYNVDYSADWEGFWQGLDSALIGSIFNSITPDGLFDNDQGNVSLDLAYPAHLATGIKLTLANQPGPEMDRLCRLEQVRAGVRSATGCADHRQPVLSGKCHLHQHHLRSRLRIGVELGVEYQVNDRLSLRAGYEPRPSAVPGNKADVLAPLGDAKLYGLGAGYQWDKDTVIDVFTWVDE